MAKPEMNDPRITQEEAVLLNLKKLGMGSLAEAEKAKNAKKAKKAKKVAPEVNEG